MRAQTIFEGLAALLIIIWFTINFSYSAWVSLNVHICKVIPLVSIELSFLFKAQAPQLTHAYYFFLGSNNAGHVEKTSTFLKIGLAAEAIPF